MRKLLLCVIFISSGTLYAQDTLAVLNLDKKKVKRIFSQAVDDALFVSVQEQGGPKGILQRNYLLNSEQVKELDLPLRFRNNLIAVVPKGPDLLVYFVEEVANSYYT